ncbi:MAG: serpin family protein, partial [Caldilineaceae bacterium]|nr:serpin family protein [Caldilineaceae bacterium]
AGIQEIAARGAVQLNVANALWPHVDYPFRKDFLTRTQRFYGVTTTPVDYSDAEQARTTINDWVAAQTAAKVQNLIPAGTLDALTRLVLVNAIYFKGDWANSFDPALTHPAPFWLTSNGSVQVPFMTLVREFRYTENAEAQILELPYAEGDLSMLILLPRAPHGLAALEQAMTLETLSSWVQHLRTMKVMVTLPRFKLTASFLLNDPLQAMGMVDAFGEAADFSGMDGTKLLYIGAVLHKAFIAVNEEGTEAAAATAVEMKLRAAPRQPPTFRADHPFLFLILEKRTGSILFLGRVVNPT